MILEHSLEFFYGLDQFHLNVPDHGDFLTAILMSALLFRHPLPFTDGFICKAGQGF